MRNTTGRSAALICLILSVVLIVLLKLVDVAAIGPEGTTIGLSTLNQVMRNILGSSDFWYKVTQAIGYFAIAVGLMLMLVSLIHMIVKKGVKKADRHMSAMFLVYFILAVVYVVFEKVIINYRPVIMPGDEHVEASFPSSHTMLLVTIMGVAAVALGHYIENKVVKIILQILCIVLIAAMVMGRLLSGVHWFTDVIGGVLIGLTLVFLYIGLQKRVRRRRTDYKD